MTTKQFTDDELRAIYDEAYAVGYADQCLENAATLILQARDERDAALARVRELESKMVDSAEDWAKDWRNSSLFAEDQQKRIAALEAENAELREWATRLAWRLKAYSGLTPDKDIAQHGKRIVENERLRLWAERCEEYDSVPKYILEAIDQAIQGEDK